MRWDYVAMACAGATGAYAAVFVLQTPPTRVFWLFCAAAVVTAIAVVLHGEKPPPPKPKE